MTSLRTLSFATYLPMVLSRTKLRVEKCFPGGVLHRRIGERGIRNAAPGVYAGGFCFGTVWAACPQKVCSDGSTSASVRSEEQDVLISRMLALKETGDCLRPTPPSEEHRSEAEEAQGTGLRDGNEAHEMRGGQAR